MLFTSTRKLDLQSNNISILNLSTFSQFPLLNHLNLSQNIINQINITGKLQMRSLKTLDLSINNITSFDYQELINYTPELNQINLKQNPLLCSFKDSVEDFFKASSLQIVTSKTFELCYETTTETAMEEFVLKNASIDNNNASEKGNNNVSENECKCICEGLENRKFVVFIAFFVVILVVLIFSMFLQCCCKANKKGKYEIHSSNLPLVNLDKE